MIAIYLLEVDALGEPVVPVVFYGPIEERVSTDWLGHNKDGEVDEDVPEIQFPTYCKYRNPGWLCIGSRPSRAVPRGILFRIVGVDGASGTAPPGVVESDFVAAADGNGDDNTGRAVYDGATAAGATVVWDMVATDDASKNSGPAGDGLNSDFVVTSSLAFVATDATTWRAFSGPPAYAGQEPLTVSDLRQVWLTEKSPPAEPDRGRQVLFDLDPEPPIFCPMNQQVPVTYFWPFNNVGLTQWRVDRPLQVLWRVNNVDIGPAFGRAISQFFITTAGNVMDFFIDMQHDPFANFFFLRCGTQVDGISRDLGMITTGSDVELFMVAENGGLRLTWSVDQVELAEYTLNRHDSECDHQHRYLTEFVVPVIATVSVSNA